VDGAARRFCARRSASGLPLNGRQLGIGLDVRKKSISIAVLNAAGKVVMESVTAR
jgi:hypothetical protein